MSTPSSPKFAANQVSRELSIVSAATPVGELPQRRRSAPEQKTQSEIAETAAFQSGIRSMLSEWSSLSDRMASLLAGLASGAPNSAAPGLEEPAPRQRNHTPLEAEDFRKVTERPTFKPEIRRGKLYFSCPACQHPTAVFKAYTGKATRCPSCFSAIRTPDPKTGRKAHNLERDIDAFLHPERITAVLPRRRTIFTAVPLPSLNAFLAIAGSALVLGGTALSMRTAAVSDEVALAPPVEVAPASAVDTRDLASRATAIVDSYLAARGAVAKSAYVRDGGRVAPLMNKSFLESGEPIGHRSLAVLSSGLSPVTGEDQFVTRVRADLNGGRSQEFIVQHLPHGDVIEWEASTGFNARPWENIAERVAGNEQEVAQMRVLARPDNYFNYRFSNEDDFYCVRLEAPEDGELLGFGYATREQAETLGLLDATAGATSDNPERLTLDLKFAPDTAQTRQVEIVGVTQQGWRATAASMLAGGGAVEPQ